MDDEITLGDMLILISLALFLLFFTFEIERVKQNQTQIIANQKSVILTLSQGKLFDTSNGIGSKLVVDPAPRKAKKNKEKTNEK